MAEADHRDDLWQWTIARLRGHAGQHLEESLL